MRQNLHKWLATDVIMNYVCVADTHQHHRLLFPSYYTLNDKTHTYAHLHCQLTGELRFFFLNHTYFIIFRKQRMNILKILPQSLVPRIHIIKLHASHCIVWPLMAGYRAQTKVVLICTSRSCFCCHYCHFNPEPAIWFIF